MEKTVNEILQDNIILRQIYLERYSKREIKKILSLLRKVERELILEIETIEDSPTKTDQKKLLVNIRKIIQSSESEMWIQLDKVIAILATSEILFQTKLIENTITVKWKLAQPGPNQIQAAIQSRPFQGRILKEWYKDAEQGAFQRLRSDIREGYIQGQTTDQIVNRVKNNSVMRTRRGVVAVVRTALNHTANTAREILYSNNEDLIEGIRYVATLDKKTSAICRSLDGKFFKLGHGPRPPQHPNCLIGNSIVTSSSNIKGVSKRWFDGNIVIIRTAANRVLQITPNHPVLCNNRWVAAKNINVGDQLVRHTVSERKVIVDNNRYDRPFSIEQVSNFFNSFSTDSRKLPGSTPDFHGDGISGETTTIFSNHFLSNAFESFFNQTIDNFLFQFKNFRFSMPSSILFGLSFNENVGICQNSFYGTCTDTITSTDFRHIFPTQIHFTNFFIIQRNRIRMMMKKTAFRNSSNFHIPFFQSPGYSSSADSELIRNIINGFAGLIKFDKVISVDVCNFRGHVYNLETDDNYYCSDDIIVHNCRSTTVPVTKSWKKLGIDLEEIPAGTRASMNGQVPETLTYYEWLKTQSKNIQNEVLGIKKGELFRQGKLSITAYDGN